MRFINLKTIACLFIFFTLFIYKNSALAEANLAIRPYPNNSSSWLVYGDVARGSTLNGMVEVVNLSDQIVHISIYPVDVNKSAEGGLVAGGEAGSGSAMGAWIRIPQRYLSLGANESKIIKFNIKVPTNIIAKEYIGAIMITEKQKSSSSEVNYIGVIARTGLRVYMTINSGPAAVSLIEPDITPEDDVSLPKEKLEKLIVKKSSGGDVATVNPGNKLVSNRGTGESFDYITISSSTLATSTAGGFISDFRLAGLDWFTKLYNFVSAYRVNEDQLYILLALGSIMVLLLVIIFILV